VYDCPDSHMVIGIVLLRLREATMEINRATDDPRTKAIMERTWLLQDRLVFEDMVSMTKWCVDIQWADDDLQPNSGSTTAIRALGHNQLCGVLHVSWQTKYSVGGQYVVCLLYRHFLVLASANKSEEHDQVYRIQACIALNALKVEDVDNGRGMFYGLTF